MKIENLLEMLPKTYSSADRELILRAYRVADHAHEGQKRASGEPYISHCLAVAYILADLRVPPQVVAAGLLHDTVEDTGLTIEDIKRDFGDEIARLVDGVTKLTNCHRISWRSTPEEAARKKWRGKLLSVAACLTLKWKQPNLYAVAV
jgi:GTP pyrophosphokinase